jgi:hypothetical protein
MQTTYTAERLKYIEGQNTRSQDLVTNHAVSEDATNINFGALVIQGAAKNGVVLPTAAFTFQDIAGVVLYGEVSKEHQNDTGSLYYTQEDVMSIIAKGYVAVKITSAITKGQNLYFVHTAGGASPIHTFRLDADTANASKTPMIATDSGVSGDIIEAKINLDMAIGTV